MCLNYRSPLRLNLRLQASRRLLERRCSGNIIDTAYYERFTFQIGQSAWGRGGQEAEGSWQGNAFSFTLIAYLISCSHLHSRKVAFFSFLVPPLYPVDRTKAASQLALRVASTLVVIGALEAQNPLVVSCPVVWSNTLCSIEPLY